MAKVDPTLGKWIHWLKVIEGELESLVIAQKVFWAIHGLIKAHPVIQYKQSIFYWYHYHTYVAYALTGIRRQVKPQRSSISFVQLLDEITKEPTKISREYYRGLLIKSEKSRLKEKDFDRFCEKSGDLHISSNLVQRDMDKLKSVAMKNCEDFADNLIAHRGIRAPKTPPKVGEVDKVIVTLYDLCRKYRFLLLADCKNTVKEKMDYDWQEIFDYPWRQSSTQNEQFVSH